MKKSFPNFIVAGFAKCGTTFMCKELSRHPSVFICNPKEPGYFSRNYDNPNAAEEYQYLFESVASEVAIGEGSTNYTSEKYHKFSADRIARDIPQCKLIFMVRDPVKRLESGWRMRVHEGWASSSLSKAIDKQPSLVQNGLYWKCISPYLENFGKDQIHVIFQEDLRRDSENEFKRCLEYIGVDPDLQPPKGPSVNTSNAKRVPSFFGRSVVGSKLVRSLSSKVPTSFRRLGKKALTKPIQAVWDPDVRSGVVETLRPDSEQFLAYFGKPRDFWSL